MRIRHPLPCIACSVVPELASILSEKRSIDHRRLTDLEDLFVTNVTWVELKQFWLGCGEFGICIQGGWLTFVRSPPGMIVAYARARNASRIVQTLHSHLHLALPCYTLSGVIFGTNVGQGQICSSSGWWVFSVVGDTILSSLFSRLRLPWLWYVGSVELFLRSRRLLDRCQCMFKLCEAGKGVLRPEGAELHRCDKDLGDRQNTSTLSMVYSPITLDLEMFEDHPTTDIARFDGRTIS